MIKDNPTPEDDSPDLIGFFSYAHRDNNADDDALAVLCSKLSRAVEASIGGKFRLFFDRDDLEWGVFWDERLTAGVRKAAILIPVISPSYLASDWCAKELRIFEAREQEFRGGLVLPILWRDVTSLHSSVQRERLNALRNRQWVNLTDLRLDGLDTPEARRQLDKMAKRIADLILDLRTPTEIGENAAPVLLNSAVGSGSADAPVSEPTTANAADSRETDAKKISSARRREALALTIGLIFSVPQLVGLLDPDVKGLSALLAILVFACGGACFVSWWVSRRPAREAKIVLCGGSAIAVLGVILLANGTLSIDASPRETPDAVSVSTASSTVKDLRPPDATLTPDSVGMNEAEGPEVAVSNPSTTEPSLATGGDDGPSSTANTTSVPVESRSESTVGPFIAQAVIGGPLLDTMVLESETKILPVLRTGGVPADVSTVVLAVNVRDAAVDGFVTVYPCEVPRPRTANLNYERGRTYSRIVFAEVKPTGGFVCVFLSASAHLTVTINGYFPSEASFVMSQARLMDTRDILTVDGQFQGDALPAVGSETQLVVAGRGSTPPDVTVVALTIAVVNPVSDGYVAAYACGSERSPAESNLNFSADRPFADVAAIVAVGHGGSVCLFTSGIGDLVVDINGYFRSNSSFIPLENPRLMDTRLGALTVDGISAALDIRQPGIETTLTVRERGGIPYDVSTVVLTVTVTDAEDDGSLSIYPCGSVSPSWTFGYSSGDSIANFLYVPVNAEGAVCLRASSETQVAVNASGYFVQP